MNAFVVFIRRPVFATMVTAFLVVLGLLSYRGLGVDQLPQVDLPIVNIFTSLRGASPEEVETQVTKPLEEAINTIGGIDEIRSYSLEGASFISVSFALEKSTQEVVQDVRDRHTSLLERTPAHLRHDVMCELNVIEQVVNVAHTTVVRDAWDRGQNLTLHGWVYGLKDGLLKDLKMTVPGSNRLGGLYRVAVEHVSEVERD